MNKPAPKKKQTVTNAVNIGYSLILSIAVTVWAGFSIPDPDALIGIVVALILGSVVAIVLGWAVKKSLLVTLVITTGTFLLAGLMIGMQMDLSVPSLG